MEVIQHDKWELPAGAVIKCSNAKCGETIGRLNVPIKKGRQINDGDITGPHIRPDKEPLCLTCGFRWYFEERTLSGLGLARIHLASGGWFPPEERITLQE